MHNFVFCIGSANLNKSKFKKTPKRSWSTMWWTGKLKFLMKLDLLELEIKVINYAIVQNVIIRNNQKNWEQEAMSIWSRM